MGLLAASITGFICTALSCALMYAMQIFPILSAKFVVITMIVVGAVLLVIVECLRKKDCKVLKVLLFLIASPIFYAAILHSLFSKYGFLQQGWLLNAIAIGGAIVLLAIYLIIIGGIDSSKTFSFMIAGLFFIGLTIGIYFLLKLMITPAFASTFAACALIALSSITRALDIPL